MYRYHFLTRHYTQTDTHTLLTLSHTHTHTHTHTLSLAETWSWGTLRWWVSAGHSARTFASTCSRCKRRRAERSSSRSSEHSDHKYLYIWYDCLMLVLRSYSTWVIDPLPQGTYAHGKGRHSCRLERLEHSSLEGAISIHIYEAEICAILLPLRCSFRWYPYLKTFWSPKNQTMDYGFRPKMDFFVLLGLKMV